MLLLRATLVHFLEYQTRLTRERCSLSFLCWGPPSTIDGAALPLLPFQAEIDTGVAKFTADHATAASDEPRASFVGGRTAP